MGMRKCFPGYDVLNDDLDALCVDILPCTLGSHIGTKESRDLKGWALW